jgi:dihydroorotase
MKDIQRLELPAAADMHVHLRQGELMDLVVPTIRQGGVDTVFVYEFCREEYSKANITR